MNADQTIWKYQLAITGEQHVSMPQGAEILCAQMQGEQLCLWALVEPNIQPQDRLIVIHGTGHPVMAVYPPRRYIGTVQAVQMLSGPLVWHVFEMP